MYHLTIAPLAKSQLKKLPPRYKQSLIEAIEELKENPFIGKPLSRELSGLFAYKIHVYRLIYIVNRKDHTVVIISAGHRATIYE